MPWVASLGIHGLAGAGLGGGLLPGAFPGLVGDHLVLGLGGALGLGLGSLFLAWGTRRWCPVGMLSSHLAPHWHLTLW